MSIYTNMLAAYGVTEARPGGKKMTEKALMTCPIGKSCSVLEVGCGIGDTAKMISSLEGVTITAIDSNEKMMEKAKKRHGVNDNIKWICGNLETLELPKQSFDAILMESVLSFTDIPKSLPKLHSLLKPEGILFCLDPLYLEGLTEEQLEEYKEFYGFHSLLTEEEWNTLFTKNGFRIMHRIKSEDIIQEHDELLAFPDLLPDYNLDMTHVKTMEKHLELSEKYFPFFDYSYTILQKT